MIRLSPILLIATLVSGCTKCVTCDIKLKEAYLTAAVIDEYCGTTDDIEEEEKRLVTDEYACLECVVNAPFGTTSSGFHCGDRAFTDSLEDAWRTGAMQAGYLHNCFYYRDTLEVVCVLKQ